MNNYVFSSAHYTRFLKTAKLKGYSFVKAKDVVDAKSPFILLRHDVDLDIDCALKMAKIESRQKIYSTYFILLYNNFYNPFTEENRKKILEIKKLGHEIGIHWDSRNYKRNYKKNLKRNLELLEDIICEKIISGSQHEPVATGAFNINSIIKNEVYRDNKNLLYISDSSMRWRNQTPEDVIKAGLNVHLLVHPFWWIMNGSTMKEKFTNFEKMRKNKDKKLVTLYYNDTVNFLKKRKSLDKKHALKLSV